MGLSKLIKQNLIQILWLRMKKPLAKYTDKTKQILQQTTVLKNKCKIFMININTHMGFKPILMMNNIYMKLNVMQRIWKKLLKLLKMTEIWETKR